MTLRQYNTLKLICKLFLAFSFLTFRLGEDPGYLKKKFLWARKLSDWTVADRLHDAHLKWLRRRGKYKVTKVHLKPRVRHSQKVLDTPDEELVRWGYTDGITIYLDRGEEDFEHSQQAALGTYVWRESSNRAALFQDNIGPSAYRKAQGYPLRIWGMLAAGKLSISILEEGEVMNTENYVDLIEDHFESWLGGCDLLVCDFERCLRSKAAVAALARIGVELVQGYPRASQDFNAIENVWKIFKNVG